MPELPEVETLRRDLERTLVGRTIVGLNIGLPKMFVSSPGCQSSDLVGRIVRGVRRRAKFLLLELSGDAALVAHLRLSGQLVHRANDGQTLVAGGHPVPSFEAILPHRATHVTFTLDDGSTLFLTDIRQFGRLWFMPADEVAGLLARSRLGPEPLSDELTAEAFAARLSKRHRAMLKPLLLDQRFVGGVGNIYADEIAFAAGLSPTVVVGRLSSGQQKELYRAVRSVLGYAVTHGVAEILNGRAAVGRDFPRVHGRAGQACPRCGTTIVKTRVGGRGTYTCPFCQAFPAEG